MRTLPFPDKGPLAALGELLGDPAVTALHFAEREARLIRDLQPVAAEPPLGAAALDELLAWCQDNGHQSGEQVWSVYPAPDVCITIWRSAGVGVHGVVRVVPRPLPTLDDLARQGVLAPLAARLLSASLDADRSLLLVGEREACWQLGLALCAGGHSVAACLPPDLPLPAGWMPVANAGGVARGDTERQLHFTGQAEDLVRFCLATRAAVGWMPAPRLFKALMRFELAAHPHDGPLVVPAALDVVVVCGRTQQQASKVLEISELVVAEPAYRPLPLFATGAGPFANALTPCGLPTYGAELRTRGHDVLMDELERAVPAPPPSHAAPADQPQVTLPVALEPLRPGPGRIEDESMGGAQAAQHVPLEPVSDDPEHAPGWELENIIASGGDVAPHHAGGPNAEDQELAAQFGLGPPPRPAGMRAPGPKTPGQSLYSYPTGQQGGDEDVLDRGLEPSSDAGQGQQLDPDDDEGSGQGGEQRSFDRILADRQSEED